MPIITTQRLILRNICEDDADDIFAYSSSPNVGPNAGWKPHESREETLEIMKAIFLSHPNIFGIVLAENVRLIGSIGLINDPKRQNEHTMMLGYALSEQYWGKGIMTEAVNAVLQYGFDQLKLDLISAYCYPFNLRSKHVLTKCGFSYEGTLKQAEQIYDGRIFDNECYALTAEDYFERSGR